MRDVLDPILEWYDNGMAFGLATVVQYLPQRPAATGGRDGRLGRRRGRRQRLRRLRRGRGLRGRQAGVQTGEPCSPGYGFSDDDAFAVGLTCGGIIHVFVSRSTGDLSRAARRDRGHRRSSTSRSPWRPSIDGPRRHSGPDRVIWRDRPRRHARHRPDSTLPSTTTCGACSRRALTGHVTSARTGERRQDELTRLRAVVRAAAADAGVRRHRLRRGRRAGRQVPRLPRHGLRRTARVRHRQAVPGRRRGGRRVAAPVPRRASDVDARTVICVLTHDPKFDVPLLEVALQPTRLHRRDGQPAHPRRPAGPAARGRA